MTASNPKSNPNQVMDPSYKVIFLVVCVWTFLLFILAVFFNDGWKNYMTGFWVWTALAISMYIQDYKAARLLTIGVMILALIAYSGIYSIIELVLCYMLYDFLNSRFVNQSRVESESVLPASKNKNKEKKQAASSKTGKRLPNGDVYFGKFVAGKPSGKGRYEYKNGNVYTGPFKAGKMTGKGMLEFKNGQIYKGDFIDGKRTGKGVLTWPYGATYKGDFVNGRRTGKGTFIWCDGTVYEGNFINGKKCE